MRRNKPCQMICLQASDCKDADLRLADPDSKVHNALSHVALKHLLVPQSLQRRHTEHASIKTKPHCLKYQSHTVPEIV